MSLAKRGPTSGKPINPTPAQEERFWGHVDIRADNECWQWMGYINPNGYGAVNVGGSIRPAHRVAYAISKAIIYFANTLRMCHRMGIQGASQCRSFRSPISTMKKRPSATSKAWSGRTE